MTQRVPDHEYHDHLRRGGVPHPEHHHFLRFTAPEMAEMLGWTWAKLNRRLNAGNVRATRVADRWLFTGEQAALLRRRAALEEMLEADEIPPAVIEALDALDGYDSDCRLAEWLYTGTPSSTDE